MNNARSVADRRFANRAPFCDDLRLFVLSDGIAQIIAMTTKFALIKSSLRRFAPLGGVLEDVGVGGTEKCKYK